MPTTSHTGTDADAALHKKRLRAAFRWNTASGILFGCQSVVMLIVITRVCDVYAAGVFTIAYANANLFLHLGKFGMRKFQASDRADQFGFREYRASRVVSSLAMIVASGAYLAWSATTLGYSTEKTLVILTMVLFKVVDAVEDVYTGAYQVRDRLDVGARMVAIRLLATMVAFGALLAACGNLLVALALSTVFTAALFAGQVLYVKRRYDMPDRSSRLDWGQVRTLFVECVPLFLSNFLLFYMGNAPKYAIDAMMDDAAQAYYGYIAMPVFVVTLLAGFIYNPLITELTDAWQAGNLRPFAVRFLRIGGIIVALTAACLLLAFLLGVPVLNLLYNTDVADYLAELLVLVAGGGFLALATLATLGLTIVRFQTPLAPIYLVGSVAAWAVSNWAVSTAGITGASWAYFSIMAALALVLATTFAYRILRDDTLPQR